MIILHNARCSKSREALDLLENQHCELQVRNYLLEPLTETEIRDLLKLLGCKAENIMRSDEPLYKEKYAGKKMTEAACIRALVKHPILLQRPIVIDGDKAVIGRPPVLVLELAKATKTKKSPSQKQKSPQSK